MANPISNPLAALHPQNPALRLLHGGADYFPALCAAIDAAHSHIWLETYIFADDATGAKVKACLIAAAQRGVRVHLRMDGFGSGDYGRALVQALKTLGIAATVHRPQRWWQRGNFLSTTLLRRLHRKLCVVDESWAFVGGINVIDDHNHAPHSGEGLGPRFDFAVKINRQAAPQLFASIQQAVQRQTRPPRYALHAVWNATAALVARDNLRNRRAIEQIYLKLLGSARQNVWLANAYFVPGRKLRRAILDCAQRGVAVHLLLQGRVEYPLQHHATQALYGQMLAAGVQLYEYTASFLHAKVAVVDGQRATVGSSNIDPFSLLLAEEANVLVHDATFASELRAALQAACATQSVKIEPLAARSLWRRGMDWMAYGLIRLGARMVRHS